MHAPSPSERPRRTQQERRDNTQHALLEATVSALVELGYNATTTLEVERRAGVSRGARIHHFPTKAALLASAVDHLYDQLSAHYEEAFGRPVAGHSDPERFRAGLRLLWSIYKGRDYIAVLELHMASRTDAELRERLGSVGDRHRDLAIEAAHRHFPALGSEPARALIEAVHVVLIGLLMQQGVRPDDIETPDIVLRMIEQLAELHLQLATQSHPKQRDPLSRRPAAPPHSKSQ